MADCPTIITSARTVTNSTDDCITNSDWNVVASGLNSVRNTLQPFISGADNLATCSPVYLTTGGNATGSGSAGCRLIGSHLGSGRVAAIGPVFCVTVGANVSPCDELTYDSGQDAVVASPGGGELLALQAGSSGDCISVMHIGAQPSVQMGRSAFLAAADFVHPMNGSAQGVNFDTVANDDFSGAALPTGFTAPCTGVYTVEASADAQAATTLDFDLWVRPTYNGSGFGNHYFQHRGSFAGFAGAPNKRYSVTELVTLSAGDSVGLDLVGNGTGAVTFTNARLVVTGLACT